MRILETLYWNVRELTAKISNLYDCSFNNKDTKIMSMASIGIALVCQFFIEADFIACVHKHDS